jgi:hypothetical protein
LRTFLSWPKSLSEKKASQASAQTLSYTNCRGGTYYLHEGKTKTGKPRYFVAKTVREEALAAMPEGYEFSESINGVVSVRKVRPGAPEIPDTDLAMVRAELARHEHLRGHRVESRGTELVVYEPSGGISSNAIAHLASVMYLSPKALEARLGREGQPTRYDPVMKFVLEEPGIYSVHRMTYRGDGGWSWPLASGPLNRLVKKYVKHVGTEEFFELL